MAMVIELLIVISLIASEVLDHHEAKAPAQALRSVPTVVEVKPQTRPLQSPWRPLL